MFKIRFQYQQLHVGCLHVSPFILIWSLLIEDSRLSEKLLTEPHQFILFVSLYADLKNYSKWAVLKPYRTSYRNKPSENKKKNNLINKVSAHLSVKCKQMLVI